MPVTANIGCGVIDLEPGPPDPRLTHRPARHRPVGPSRSPEIHQSTRDRPIKGYALVRPDTPILTGPMAGDLDAQVEAFRIRPLDRGPYTFVAAAGAGHGRLRQYRRGHDDSRRCRRRGRLGLHQTGGQRDRGRRAGVRSTEDSGRPTGRRRPERATGRRRGAPSRRSSTTAPTRWSSSGRRGRRSVAATSRSTGLRHSPRPVGPACTSTTCGTPATR